MATMVQREDARKIAHTTDISLTMTMREAQRLWAAKTVRERLQVLRAARHKLAGRAQAFAQSISPNLARTPADTMVAEILPMLDAFRFLEQRAESILAIRRLGRRGLPFWLAGVSSEIHRAPMGLILVIGPSNYPLFLPGVQALQALAAGNAVIWKSGRGGQAVADLFAQAMESAGLPNDLLRVTDETVAATYAALRERPDKVFFTGSAATGRALMREMAETLTPCVMELSGCDAVVVLPSAELSRVVKALAFGMRLNGSATCMAPRRVLLVDATPAGRKAFLTALQSELLRVRAIRIPEGVRQQLRELLDEAVRAGARMHGDPEAQEIAPVVVTEVQPGMRLAQADIFAPVLALIDVAGEAGVLAAQQACSFALTAVVFGDEAEARRLAAKMTAGTVLVNDIIVPTADPRVPFGGRRESGFGVTRGAEGLLEMTAVKTIAMRRGRSVRHYEATTSVHERLFEGLIAAAHAKRWVERWNGLKQVMSAGRKFKGKR
jgi:acyl-CoA reductase-like NAD-dependent aldehyde dehydrogenase